MLIPDARRSLFGGLIDHAVMLRRPAPDLEAAVADYRRLRSGPGGWMIGRFVVRSSRLEDLAGCLVRTMSMGEMPWPISVVFDTGPGRDAASAAAVHALLDPAASIDIVQVALPPDGADDPEQIDRAVAATGAVHEGTVAMVRLPVGAAASPARALAAVGTRHIRRVGVTLVASDPSPSAAALMPQLASIADAGLPFTIESDTVPIVTDRASGAAGILNLVMAAGLLGRADATEILTAADPAAFEVGFGGVRWDGHAERAEDRGLLVAVASREPEGTLDDLRIAVGRG